MSKRNKKKQYMIPRWESESPLERFRKSKLYRKLVKAKQRQQLYMQSAEQEQASLAERAERMIEYVIAGGSVDDIDKSPGEDDEEVPTLADAICATLVKAGFDSFLVEVLERGGAIVVYVDERARKKMTNFRQQLSSIGEVSLVARPEDVPEYGTFIYAIEPNEEADPSLIINMLSDVRESLDPPRVRGGDLLLDTVSRNSVKVTRVLSNNRIEIQDVNSGNLQIVSSSTYENGLVAGRIVRLLREDDETDEGVFSPF